MSSTSRTPVFAADRGNDTITDFEPGLNVITFVGDRVPATDLFFNPTEPANGVVLAFESGDSVLLKDNHFNDSF